MCRSRNNCRAQLIGGPQSTRVKHGSWPAGSRIRRVMRRSDDDIDASLRVHLCTGDEEGSEDHEEATRGGRGRASSLLNGLLLAIVVVFSVLLLLLLLAQAPVEAGCDRVPGYEGPPVPPPGDRRVPGKLNVHIVPHTHDDVGWLKTVDQYFTGSNASIQQADVRRIISSVVDELSKDPARTFVYAEMAFFSRWWREQGAAERSRVRRLVKEGRLSFVNGGWCMHDEAAAHFADMIHQTSMGHEFIRANRRGRLARGSGGSWTRSGTARYRPRTSARASASRRSSSAAPTSTTWRGGSPTARWSSPGAGLAASDRRTT